MTVKLRWSAAPMLIGLMLVSSASRAAETAAYTGAKPDEFMKHWLVLGPIPVSGEPSPDENAQRKAFAHDLLSAAGGEPVVQAKAGARVAIGGENYEWRQVDSTNDIIDLKVAETPEEFSIAYAWAEIEMPEKARGLLGIGSDDGVKVWLNGKLIHENWIGRAPQPDDDVVPVEFSKGKNPLLLKIQNMQGPWGFVCRLLGPESQAKKLIAASRNGDLPEIRDGVFLEDRQCAGDVRERPGRQSYQGDSRAKRSKVRRAEDGVI